MAKQYSQCIARNLAYFNITMIEIYFDVWKSLNGRFQQRIFDPRVDILKAPWSPWESVPWVLPLLHELSHWRRDVFDGISREVTNWTKSSNVLFVADYPGLTLENYLPAELTNVSLRLMKGTVIVEQNKTENASLSMDERNFDLSSLTQKVAIESGRFHKIHTVSSFPSCYMYTYSNGTADSEPETPPEKEEDPEPHCPYIIGLITNFALDKFNTFSRSFYLIMNAYLHVFFDIPMVVRKSVD
jgi:vitamin K-dependent gamma-carboxylase